MNSSDPRQAPQRLVAGAVDLSALAQPRPAPAAQPAGDAAAGPQPETGGAGVIDVTEATFQSDVLERSMTTPVVIDFWAEWCGPCKQLSPVLEKLAAEADGAWVLAKIDVDANQQLAAAFQVQGIPMVVAVVGGRPVDGFQGVQPEASIRQWLSSLVEAAGGEAQPAPTDPTLAAAESALESGDLSGAERAFENYLSDNPGDAEAESGLAQVRLIQRVSQIDPAMEEAVSNPKDIPSALLSADALVVNGRAEDAYNQLITLVGRLGGEDRETVRKHLLELFTVAGPDDPAVLKARRQLAAVLF